MLAFKTGKYSQETVRKFKNIVSVIVGKSKGIGVRFASACLSCYDGDKDSQKRFLMFLTDNFPKIFKDKQIKGYLSSLDPTVANELNLRMSYNDIYIALEKLKTVLGGTND
jgi:hypothetical protein